MSAPRSPDLQSPESQSPAPAASDSPPPRASLRRFVAMHDGGDVAFIALAGDASPRRYHRLVGAEGTRRIAMDMSSDLAPMPAFLRIAAHLRDLGLSAPRIFAADEASGFAIIEDFGDLTYRRALEAGGDETGLYETAVDALVHLHEHPHAVAVDAPPYDLEALVEEAATFADWHAPRIGLTAARRQGFRRDFLDLWRDALAAVGERRETLVLRDVHIDNLMSLPERPGAAACGLLDFQDAAIGAAAYDAMSLLQDARRDISPALEAAMLRRYLGARRRLDSERFHRDYALLAAQRHAKVLGVFTRLAQRDGKTSYLHSLPRVWKAFARALDAAGLTDLRALLKKECPAGARILDAAASA